MGVCDGYWCIVGYGYLTSYTAFRVIPSAESFNFFVFSQTRLVYPQLFIYLFLPITITTLPMINALDYVASDIILDMIR